MRQAVSARAAKAASASAAYPPSARNRSSSRAYASIPAWLTAASVLAKVARDDLMVGLHDEAPAYQWARNKGYASAEHRAAIRSHGLSPHHRASWAIADAPTLF